MVVRLFLNEVINRTTDLGEERGWPSLQHVDIGVHVGTVNFRLIELAAAKSANLYTSTEGYRSRASSGAMEDIQGGIIGPVMGFIKKHFGLESMRLEGLEKQLRELPLGVDEENFRQEVMGLITEYCKKDRIEVQLMRELQEVVLPNQANRKVIAGGI